MPNSQLTWIASGLTALSSVVIGVLCVLTFRERRPRSRTFDVACS